MKSRRIRIESDGTAAGTRVVDKETGEPIEGVASLVICATSDGEVSAVVAFEGIELSIDVYARMATGQVIPLFGGRQP